VASRADAIPTGGTADYSIWKVIMASSVGTMIEWYDFYIFGSLAAVLALKFYPRKRYVCLRRLPGDICRGFPSASLRSALLRSYRRLGWKEIRVFS